MLISRLGSVAKSGSKTTQVTHAAEVGGLVFGGTVETSIEATHAAQVGGLTFGATASPIIEVAMGGEVRGLTFAAEYDDRNLVQHGGVVDGLTFAASVAPVVDVSHAAQVGGLVFAASVNNEDADAAAYLNAVEAADGQTLEPAVRAAVNAFVVGCKADGIWTPIKASCILAGARTLNGALVPLVGSAPTNFNFVPANYNRKTGLLGNGSSKYLNTNRAVTADPQNDCHVASYLSSGVASIGNIASTVTGGTVLVHSNPIEARLRSTTYLQGTLNAIPPSFAGVSRSSSAGFTAATNGATEFLTATSVAFGSTGNYGILRFTSAYYASRISFYSIGESIDLASLNNRVSALMSALDSAIP